MKTSSYIQDMGALENKMVEQFRTATVLSRLSSLPRSVLGNILLQRRLFALESFERVYNHAICGFVDEKVKEICREIVCDEYPSAGPNHREDLVYDLMFIGMKRAKILGATMSSGTAAAVDGVIDLVRYRPDCEGNHLHFDVQGVAAMRTYEILAGEETELLFSELKRTYGLTEEKSHFYWPHVVHDKKRAHLGESGETNADRFGVILPQLVDSEEKLVKATETIQKAGDVRIGFYKQFE